VGVSPLPDGRRKTILRMLRMWGTVRSSALAEHMGVSVKTVQRDLDELAREQLVVRIHGGAIAPREHRAPEPPLRIAALLPTRSDYYTEVWRGVEQAASERNVRLIHGVYEYDEGQELQRLRQVADLDIDGLIVTPDYTTGVQELLAALTVPTVVVERPLHPFMLSSTLTLQHPTLQLDHVYTDHGSGAMLALDHLFRLGHERVHCVLEQTPSCQRLLQGIREVQVTQAQPHWGEVSVRTVDEGAFDSDCPARQELVAECEAGRHTALLLHCDRLTGAVIRIADERGWRLGTDLSIITYDDALAATFSTPVTAVSPHRRWIGQLACDMLADRLATQGRPLYAVRPAQRLSLLPQIIDRGSTCRPPA
jgi:DNA-binding LacI/PurR family transcriptional regulator